MGTAGDREHSTEDQGVRESKQNKASRPILTFAPSPQQRAAPPSFPTEEEKTLQLDPSSLLPPLNRAGGSSSPIFVRLWGGRTDWGCLQLAAAGTTPTQTLRGLVCCVFALCTLRLGKTSRSDSHLLRLSLVIFVLFV